MATLLGCLQKVPQQQRFVKVTIRLASAPANPPLHPVKKYRGQTPIQHPSSLGPGMTMSGVMAAKSDHPPSIPIATPRYLNRHGRVARQREPATQSLCDRQHKHPARAGKERALDDSDRRDPWVAGTRLAARRGHDALREEEIHNPTVKRAGGTPAVPGRTCACQLFALCSTHIPDPLAPPAPAAT